MNKEILNIPNGIKYISEIPNYTIPNGHVIVDKGICGCGYTHWCLTNNIPTILCSPRKLLLENKMAQIDGLYYFQNAKEAIVEYDKIGLDKNEIQGNPVVTSISQEEKQSYLVKLKLQLENWLNSKLTPLTSNYGVPKIMVTYDSLEYVLDVTKKFHWNFQVVVDEFQSIFTDASFKSEVELGFVEILQDLPKVCYLSATPMLEKYLDQLDYFKDLPFYELKWPNTITTPIKINRKFTTSLTSSCFEIINYYKNNNFPKYISPKGQEIFSKEIVFFCNSVKTICDIIKKSQLTSSECNIICAESQYNQKRLKKLGKDFTYGVVPKKGEPHKMFTFCTRTAYLGADFYSTCASTVICSNINIKTLNLDIAIDLPQIMGRQRLDSNPWKNECLLLYTGKTKKETEMTYEGFCENIKEKEAKTTDLLKLYQKGSGTEKLALIGKILESKKFYMNDYVGVSKKTGNPIKNYLVQINEFRAWEISQPNYQDTIMIRQELQDDNFEVINSTSLSSGDNDSMLLFKLDSNIKSTGIFAEQMKITCNFIQDYPNVYQNYYPQILSIIPKNILNYVNTIGSDRCKALGYKESELIKEISNIESLKKIDLSKVFLVNNNYQSSDIKKTLQQIYSDNGITRTAKASDLEEWFEIKSIVSTINGKSCRGFKILKQK